MKVRLTTLLLTVAAVVSSGTLVCQAQPQLLMTRHVREAVVNGQAQWIGRLPASQTVRFDVVLALRHEAELDNFLEELYDATSPNYRQFVTVKEFTERFGPSQEDYDALIRFAAANGLKVVAGSRDAMDVQLEGTVAAVEKAFHVTMNMYQHPTENRAFFAPDREPTMDLPFQLWHVTGLDNYSRPRPMLSHRNSTVHSDVKGSCPANSYCGSDMRAAYYGGTALTGAGQTAGLMEYFGYNLADLKNYFSKVKQTNNVPIYGISTDGSSLSCSVSNQDLDNCDTEQILDMVQVISMAPGLKGLYVYNNNNESDTAILADMSTHKPLSRQLSSSWSWSPPDPKSDDPYFKKFAAQGQSFFQAAGDSGEWNSGNVDYPADDPYVIAVGGTDLKTVKAGGAWASETAWSDGGGGISPDHFAIPSWQTATASGCSSCSKTYRNGPDVSAEANFDFYVCSNHSCENGWGGTSFAAPMWSGYLALVNQQAATNHKQPAGFINPAIYSLGLSEGYTAAFHDITKGNNGEPATKGYDLATGWGSPNGSGLINALAP